MASNECVNVEFKCYVTVLDRTSARSALEKLKEVLAEAGLEADIDTYRVLRCENGTEKAKGDVVDLYLHDE